MSDPSNVTVQVAVITALAGFGGALLGATGAVFGPWWLARSQRRADADAAFLERRRSAIVEFFDAETHLTTGLEAHRDDIPQRSARANAAFTELVSRLRPGEGHVDVWLRWLRDVSTRSDVENVSRLAYQSQGEMMIFEWHRGERKITDLKKFELEVKNYRMRLLRMWDFE